MPRFTKLTSRVGDTPEAPESLLNWQEMEPERASPASVQAILINGGHSLFRSRQLCFEPVVEPLFQLRLGLFGNVVEAESGATFHICLNHFGLYV